jgi:uncharacterized damage-inducible protein DinB
MELQNAVRRVFIMLTDSLEQLEEEQYNYSCENLSGSTIGQHVRHIIEMFQRLELGYQIGEVNYDNRKRDRQIETDKTYAIRLINDIVQQIQKENKNLSLFIYPDEKPAEPERISTSYFREILYNLEHTVHHMALIRVGLREIGGIPVGDSYGVSSSTIKFRNQCVQ